MFSFGSIFLSAQLWFVIISECLYLALLCFCCTTLRDVILAERCFANVMSTTCILKHAVVCWVTAMAADTWVPLEKRTHTGASAYPRRRKPHRNLSHICVSMDALVKMHQAAGLCFSSARAFLDRFGWPLPVCVGPLKMPELLNMWSPWYQQTRQCGGAVRPD
jgi:hypothetical protein